MTDWIKSLDIPNINMLKDGQMSGALSSRISQLYDMINEEGYQSNAPISVDPGEIMFLDENGGMALSLPIAYDVWYLWHTRNVLPENAEIDINPIFEGRKTPAPLRTVYRENLEKGVTPTAEFFKERGILYVKEMRFETLLFDRSPFYNSAGPEITRTTQRDHTGEGLGDIYSGYLAFPVGPLGVMRVQSLVSESILKERMVEDDSETPLDGGDLLPPMREQSDDCMGRHLIELSYNIVDQNTEYPAEKMHGTEDILPHHWLRYWLRKDDTFPVPGEFVGLLCKAQSVPPHCWWYQKTNPFLYSGNFFETEYYTSGIIIAVIEEIARSDGIGTFEVTALSDKEPRTGHGEYQLYKGDTFEWEKLGTVYKVRVKNQDIYLRATDFARYEVDSRVAIRKKPGLKFENFTWEKLEPGRKTAGASLLERMHYDNNMIGQPFEINTDWVIVPITFYAGDKP